MNKIITIKDAHNIIDTMGNRFVEKRLKAGPYKTKIVMKNHDTGEVYETGHNKILVPASQQTACRMFGLDTSVAFPTYNTELSLENSKTPYSNPANIPIVCLWCAGRSGGTTSGVNVAANTDRIEPKNDMVPFRYVTADNDLSQTLRSTYFGRVKNATTGYISYYMKAFDTQPTLHIRYLDGTEVSSSIYTVDSTQQVEVYIEMRLAITRQDFRDYFDKVLGWDKADISTISLLTAWYDNTIPENPTAATADQIFYKWYQDILPYSKWNFKARDLTDLTEAIDFNYQIYF